MAEALGERFHKLRLYEESFDLESDGTYIYIYIEDSILKKYIQCFSIWSWEVLQPFTVRGYYANVLETYTYVVSESQALWDLTMLYRYKPQQHKCQQDWTTSVRLAKDLLQRDVQF